MIKVMLFVDGSDVLMLLVDDSDILMLLVGGCGG